MRNYEATYEIGETASNIKFYFEANKAAFWKIMKPLIPFILVLYLIDLVIAAVFFEKAEDFSLGAILASYFYLALVISWHRVVIQGADNFVPMNPLRPTRHELGFIFMIIKLFFVVGFIIALLAQVAKHVPSLEAILIPVMIAMVFAAIYFGYRISFYFPAKAVNTPITLKESFVLTKGYLLKIVLSSTLASLRYILILLGYFFVLMAVMFGVLVAFPSLMEENMTSRLLMLLVAYVLTVPALVYLQPIFTIIGVTALSNYYLHAIQNRNESVRPS